MLVMAVFWIRIDFIPDPNPVGQKISDPDPGGKK